MSRGATNTTDMTLRDFWKSNPLELERCLSYHRLNEGRPHQRSKMFVPPISRVLWVLMYNWPGGVVAVPLDVATFPANLQIPRGPQIANVTSVPELLITPGVNPRTSEIFQIRGTKYHVVLSTPATRKTIAVETLQHLLQDEINECRAQIARGRGRTAPYAIMITGPAPENLKFDWLNLDYQRRGSFGDLIRVFGFLLSTSTVEKSPDPNPWFATAFSYVLYWESYGGQPEKVGRGIVGL